ncbi:helix-turn-helix domain-containing protein [Bradyrhizobium sp. U87765 SZCCT0131]|uniref:GlxA family transcriptional regulator n=1 Tax=unclassified Bradyrhizobium TaxID=2631580 RepID=UPI001BA46A5E|nr:MULTISPECIES: helix-turn-helix domain-containing protein [unclassified Bradyrhizobium]MBR1221467.1 helix-turn-helix domain-containing protein [Bradyrhizobium sp. U87765 SZCCT0131]MBR1264610.1 helix-turn-helix domain-containing protein [Bradyrhizobium sp. U87765 SZCCT0134]MBR1304484.1 helix-turn-helix domain-containing protein [Bradyrhizobium sp. U87765 SZCCT0110]MBR1322659.1 helix-turn-helix domain-containing protein [Bradyrhizobium sp. U87765 SZCCT0109]MBR1346413.1 helix-turn-helix domain-
MGVKTVKAALPRLEVALAHDAGTAKGGLFGLTDLFTYANDFAAKRQGAGEVPPVRITHWLGNDHDGTVSCSFDSCPGSPHAPGVVIVANNHRSIFEPEHESPLPDWLRARHADGAVLAAVCGGVFMLARTGLLSGRQATTHWSFADDFKARFPDVLMESEHMVIDYGDVVTAGGAMAWADLGLRLTERFFGAGVMHDTAHFMNVDPPGREQRFYSGFEPRTKHGDAAILKAQQWLAAHRDRAASVADLAGHAGLEQRTFLRRFVKATSMKPTEYQQRLRISRARELLEFTRSPVDAVAESVGYMDVRGFRRVFQSIIGLTPSAYRQRFSPPEHRAL